MFESAEQGSQFALPHQADSGFTTPDAQTPGGLDSPVNSTTPATASGEDVRGAWAARELAELELLRVVWSCQRSDGHVVDGSINASAWLKAQLGISHGQARELLWFAKGLHRYAELYDAIHSGHLSSTKAKTLLRVFTQQRDRYTIRDVVGLIGHASRLTVNQVRLIAKAWAARVDAEIASENPDQPTTAPVTSELFLSEIIDGIVELTGTLAPDDGEVLRTAMALALKISQGAATGKGESDEQAVRFDHELLEDPSKTRPSSDQPKPRRTSEPRPSAERTL